MELYPAFCRCYVFSAFAIEAKVNFVGWKLFEEDWPERNNLREKIDLLLEKLDLKLDWGERSLQSVYNLKCVRDTIAHGKPEIVDTTLVTEVEPEVWDSLKGQWETSLTPDNIERCCEDVDKLWRMLLDAAGISVGETLTHGMHNLKKITN